MGNPDLHNEHGNAELLAVNGNAEEYGAVKSMRVFMSSGDEEDDSKHDVDDGNFEVSDDGTGQDAGAISCKHNEAVMECLDALNDKVSTSCSDSCGGDGRALGNGVEDVADRLKQIM